MFLLNVLTFKKGQIKDFSTVKELLKKNETTRIQELYHRAKMKENDQSPIGGMEQKNIINSI